MLKVAGIYISANMISAAIPFLLLPLLTNYLTPAEYGIVTMFQILTNGILPLVGFSGDSAINRQYFDKESSDFPNYVTNALYILIVSSIAVYVLFIFSGSLIEKYSEFPKNWLWAVLLFAVGQKITEILLIIWRVQNKAIEYGIFRIIRTGLDMGLSIYFIIVFKRSWEGRIEGQLIAILFFALLALFYLYRGNYIKHGFNKLYVKSILKFGIPLIPHGLGAIIITYSDRIFITNMIGINEMGLYSVGFQIAMIMGLTQNSFNQAWQPWLYEKLKKDLPEDKVRIVKFTYIYFVVILIVAAAITMIAPYIVHFMTSKEYSGAVPFIGWITFGFAFNGMYKMVVNYLFFLRKTFMLGMITLFTAITNIILNYYLIKINGSIGAAQSTAISFFIQFVVVWYISSKYIKMNWFKIKRS